MTNATRSDPIGDKYFEWIEFVDFLSIRLFALIALVSVLLLLVDRNSHSLWHGALEVLFVFLVIFLFLIGLMARLYFTPRAEEKRRQDFLSNAFHIPLTHERTVGYYNNGLTGSIERIAAQLLENSLFTKTISRMMARRERIFVLLYFAIYLLIILNRDSNLELITIVSQVLFSEQALSRCVRLEWLRMRSEKTFNEVYRMFQSKPDKDNFQVQTLDSLVDYESTKATAGITLSSKLFNQMNPPLMREWKDIQSTLNI
jgi:hypothetical protein